MVKQNNKRKQFWRDIFIKNNKTRNIRVLLFEGVSNLYIIFSIYYVWHTGRRLSVAFGVGLASLLGGVR